MSKDNSMAAGKICSRCKKFKPYFCFHKDLTKRDKHKTICKECRRRKKGQNVLTQQRKGFDRNLMTSIYRSIKRNRNGYLWEKVVGYTLSDLKAYIEEQFTSEMSWENFGSVWWIDKIIPRAAYHYSRSSNELRKCWSLKNLRPLLKVECMRKKNKFYWHLIDKYNLYSILPIGIIVSENRSFIEKGNSNENRNSI